MKKMKEFIKSPAFAGIIVLCLVFAGITVHFGMQLHKTHTELAELQSRVETMQTELETLISEAEQEAEAEAEAEDHVDAKEEESSKSEESAPAKPQSSQNSNTAKPQTPANKYVTGEKVMESILGDLQYSNNPDKLIFRTIELDESLEPAVYHVTAETSDLYRKLIYKVNAETGLIRDRIFYNADNFEEEGQIGLHKEIGDSSEPEPWNQYWELYCRPSGQAYYEDIPIIRFDSEEGRAYLEALEEKKLQDADENS